MDSERMLAYRVKIIYGISHLAELSFKSFVSLYKNKEVINVMIQEIKPKKLFLK